MLKNSANKFGLVAIGLHWLVALLVIGLLAVGLIMEEMESSATKLQLYGLHKSFGATVLFLMGLRLAWKLSNVQPDFVATMKPIEKTAARLAYLVLYILLFAMPMSGWLMSSAAGRPVSVFGLFTLPDFVGKDPEWREFFGECHEIAAYALMGLIALHVLAALKHHFIHKDATLRKMLPLAALTVLLAGPAAPALAQPPAWTVDPSQSKIAYAGKQMGDSFEGQFKSFTAEILFSAEDLAGSRVSTVIDLASADSGDAGGRDKTMRESSWFDMARFPQATFTSSSFRKLEGGSFEVTGDLSIKGKTLPVTFPFTLDLSKTNDGKETATMNASFNLKRLAFDLGVDNWKDETVIENNVTVSLHLVAQRPLEP